MRGVRTTMQGLIAKNFTTVKVPVKSWGGGKLWKGDTGRPGIHWTLDQNIHLIGI